MNKSIGILVVVLAVIVLSGWWLSSSKSSMEGKGMADDKMAVDSKVAMEKEVMAKKEAMPKAEGTMAPKSDDAMMKKDDAMMDKSTGSAMLSGQYVAYDASKLAFAKEGKVVLFFRASWCPTCRALDSDIKANLSQIPKDVLLLDVDYDQSAALKKQYGVTYQHTLVQVAADGQMIAKWSGSEGLKELLSQLK
ncbi:MAG: thioredoxin family protein [Candidatus Moraniibacteriota bacterium]